jgi:hypothetical protein
MCSPRLYRNHRTLTHSYTRYEAVHLTLTTNTVPRREPIKTCTESLWILFYICRAYHVQLQSQQMFVRLAHQRKKFFGISRAVNLFRKPAYTKRRVNIKLRILHVTFKFDATLFTSHVWPSPTSRSQSRGVKIPGARSPWRQNIVRTHLIFVSPQY